jgi:hypothetical protein
LFERDIAAHDWQAYAMRLEYLEDPGGREPRVVLLSDARPAAVEALRATIDGLTSVGDQIRVESLEGVDSVDGCRLRAVVAARDEGPESLGDRSFRCALTVERWRRLSGLLAPFASGLGTNASQYLTDVDEIQWIISTSRHW